MKTKLRVAFRLSTFVVALALLLILNLQPSTFAQGTAFTYQGRLNSGGNPANGTYDLAFSAFTASNAVGQVGGTFTNNATAVNNGLFTVPLDFGPGIFTGTNLWLQIEVRTNGSGIFTALTPLQALTPAPYAIFANTASNLSGTLPAAQLAGTYGNPVTFNNGANTFDGSFYGQFFGSSFIGGNFVGNFIGTGSGLADVWHTGGNLGTTPGANFLGTTDNQPLLVKVNGQQAMRYEPTYETPNVIGGWSGNYVQAGLPGATIGGGGSPVFYNGRPQPNIVTNNGYYGTIAGGYNNTVKGYGGVIAGGSVNMDISDFGVIGGGQSHTIDSGAGYSVIGGGYQNYVTNGAYGIGGQQTIGGGYQNYNAGWAATIAGGWQNRVTGTSDFLGGGTGNSVSNDYAAVVGGFGNNANAYDSLIGGGAYQFIQTNASYSFIGGGYANIMGGYLGTIGGGWGNNQASYGAMIGGGNFNTIEPQASYAVIGGGNQNFIQNFSGLSAIGGGYLNNIQTNSGYSVIGGGSNNNIQTNAGYSFIGGGLLNNIQGNSDQSVIAGGNANGIQTSARESFVGGGFDNIIRSGAGLSFIGGGVYHSIGGPYSFIGGGAANVADGFLSTSVGGQGNSALANNSTVVGGLFNTNFGVLSFIGGGDNNIAGGFGAVIAGGESNRTAGSFSMAAGYHANALHDGTFVWADYTPENFGSTLTNQFLIRAQNGVGINTNNPQSALHVNGTVTMSGFQLPTGAAAGKVLTSDASGNGAWQSPSGYAAGSGLQLSGNTFSIANNGVNNAMLASDPLSLNKVSGGTMFANSGTPFVGVGRSSQVTSAEVFGLQSGVTTAGFFGGMYAQTAGVLTKPFYGYSAGNGATTAYHYLDGNDGNRWKLYNGGDWLTVNRTGEVGIGITPTNKLHVLGGATFTSGLGGANQAVVWTPGSASWSFTSDRNTKEKLTPVDSERVLEKVAKLRLSEWSYIGYAQRHIGPMAQDFHAAFPLNESETSLNDADLHGVALAAIQGLNQKLEDQAEALKTKDARIHTLENRLADLEKAVARLAQHDSTIR